VRSSRAKRMSEFIADKPAPYSLIKLTNQIKVDDDTTHNLFMQERSRLNQLKEINE
jgi:hypothetical protein